jgi:hypothetical protein
MPDDPVGDSGASIDDRHLLLEQLLSSRVAHLQEAHTVDVIWCHRRRTDGRSSHAGRRLRDHHCHGRRIRPSSDPGPGDRR